jgi:hypothetical protein
MKAKVNRVAEEELEDIQECEALGYNDGHAFAEDSSSLELKKLSRWDYRHGLPGDEYLHERLFDLIDTVFHEVENLDLGDYYRGNSNRYNEAYFKGFKQGIMDFIMKK